MAKDKVDKPFDIIDTETGKVIPFPKKREREEAKDGSMRGRKPIYITPEQWHTIKAIAGFMATDEEIADAVQVSARTLTDDYHGEFFQAIKKQGQSNAKISLRRAQFESAIKKGNTSMQMFLGKVYLNQREYNETEQTNPSININVVPATENDINIGE